MSVEMTSSKPYIVRAFYDWICDNDLTPYIAVDVNVYGVLVPMAFVNDGQIILNVAPGAVGSISLEGENIEFTARFSGKLEHLTVPYGAISAIYAKENGAGTSLAIEHPVEDDELSLSPVSAVDNSSDDEPDPTPPSKPRGRASLKVVK
ncbi:ClpXP protease specificity-enhancing factor [Thalassotalea sp. 1_MG-2023]|uniref:ClpXP protease specificity-enhancing factor n=1 Tax=Thalassotalea sp. 1_MG-2023 TaxID=3062680 RepID=UPI0026E247B5|nr:ClpXP protease specificity-enhancing factor [Thalassotalea sp. 1_MG-2023]MDO6425851.1 ClpXP protease specificity-enhancing factor [Thalassotalea sp. 1_MG-2023]